MQRHGMHNFLDTLLVGAQQERRAQNGAERCVGPRVRVPWALRNTRCEAGAKAVILSKILTANVNVYKRADGVDAERGNDANGLSIAN